MNPININDKLNLVKDFWSPKVIAELNGQQVKIAKIQGDFVWHDHKDEDELFYILKGQLIIAFRDKEVVLNEGVVSTIVCLYHLQD